MDGFLILMGDGNDRAQGVVHLRAAQIGFAKTEFPIVWVKASRTYDSAEILGEILQATTPKATTAA